jgi:hypothetical protein
MRSMFGMILSRWAPSVYASDSPEDRLRLDYASQFFFGYMAM